MPSPGDQSLRDWNIVENIWRTEKKDPLGFQHPPDLSQKINGMLDGYGKDLKIATVCSHTALQIFHGARLEKIKTIGDSYMCVGGLPVPDSNNASAIVSAALEVRDYMVARKSQPCNPGFEIRIGIHSGSVVAGIVGTKKFAYDIWGDTVNTASRMESSGEAGKVNISQTTYQFIRDNPGFAFEYRGKVTAKSKGEIDMYFVDRKPAR